MPARKRNLVLLSHREAVDLAPDSTDKRAVMECANARFVLLNGDITDQNLRMLAQLHQDVSLMPARASDDTQRLRILAFGLRLTGQVSRLRKERDQIMEAAFRFARIAHYRQTGVRVGDLFDPIAEQADQEPAAAETNTGPAESNGGPVEGNNGPVEGNNGPVEGNGGPVANASGSKPGEEPAGEQQPRLESPGGCRAATTTQTAMSPRQVEQTPAETSNGPVESNGGPVENNGGPVANAQGSKQDAKPASNRQIKEYLHYLKRHRVNGDTRENFRRRAQAEGWDKSRLALEAHKLTAA